MPTLAVIKLTEDQSSDVLEEFSFRIVRGIREHLWRETRGSGKLASSIRAHVYGREIIVESDLPYAKEMDQGRRSRVMWSLINKVIPIKLKNGTTIFRRVTADAIRRGKWRISPSRGMEFVERGVEIARSEMSLRAQLIAVVQTSSFT